MSRINNANLARRAAEAVRKAAEHFLPSQEKEIKQMALEILMAQDADCQNHTDSDAETLPEEKSDPTAVDPAKL